MTLTDLTASSLSVQTTVMAPTLSAYKHVFLAKLCASRTLCEVDCLVPTCLDISSTLIVRNPGAGDSLDCDVPGLGQHVADLTESELGRLLAEVSLAANGGILHGQAPGHKVLLHLEKTTDVNLDEDR